MIKTLEKFYSEIIPNKETFETNKPNSLPLVLAVLTVYILLLLLGKFLWNNYLVKYLSIVNPVESIIDILAISLLASLILPH